MIKPTDIKLHQASHVLEVVFSDGKTFKVKSRIDTDIEVEYY